MADQSESEAFQRFIELNLSALVDQTSSTARLLIDLYSAGVIDREEKSEIEAQLTEATRNGKLWSILMRRHTHLETIIRILDRRSEVGPARILRKFGSDSADVGRAAPTAAGAVAVPSAIVSPGLLQLSGPKLNSGPVGSVLQLGSSAATTSVADARSFQQAQQPILKITGRDSSAAQSNCEQLLSNYTPQKYKSTGKHKGLALIVNIITFDDEPDAFRHGATEDSNRLQQVLENHNYLVCSLTDATMQDLTRAIEEFQGYFDKFDVDSCLVAVMSHGMDNDRIYTKDGQPFSLWNGLVAKFSNKNALSKKLIGLPKIFLLNYCRGRTIDTGTTTHDALPYKESIRIIPSWTDMLVCYSTLQGHYSYRSTGTGGQKSGSWFIQSFCDVVEKYAETYHLLQMLDIISHLMKLAVGEGGEKQICPYYNIGFDKEFWFRNPSPQGPQA